MYQLASGATPLGATHFEIVRTVDGIDRLPARRPSLDPIDVMSKERCTVAGNPAVQQPFNGGPVGNFIGDQASKALNATGMHITHRSANGKTKRRAANRAATKQARRDRRRSAAAAKAKQVTQQQPVGSGQPLLSGYELARVSVGAKLRPATP